MSAPSLHEIESSLSSLWLRESVRDGLEKGDAPIAPSINQSSIDQSGVELYATLLAYGQQELMNSIYPYCSKVLKKKWEPTVKEYFLKHPPNHFNLNRAAKKFSNYLSSDCPLLMSKFPFLAELAEYEWLELELLEMDEVVALQPNLVLAKPEHFIQYAPLLNPVLILRQYTYPVSAIADKLAANKSVAKTKPETSRVAIYRHPLTNHCKFLDVGEVAYEVIQASRQKPHSYADLISLSVERASNLDPQKTVVEFLDLIEKLQELQVFIGSTKIA